MQINCYLDFDGDICITLDVEASETIENVQAMIRANRGIEPKGELHLMGPSGELHLMGPSGKLTLSYYNITSESKLLIATGKSRILVQTSVGTSFKIDVGTWETVYNVKNLLAHELGAEKQHLILRLLKKTNSGFENLDADKTLTLSQCKIDSKSTLMVVVERPPSEDVCGAQPSQVVVNGSKASVKLDLGTWATFDLQQCSMEHRLAQTTTFVHPGFLWESNFQHFYKGDGTPKDEKVERIVNGLMTFALADGDEDGDASSFALIDRDGDTNSFEFVDSALFHTCVSASGKVKWDRARISHGILTKHGLFYVLREGQDVGVQFSFLYLEPLKRVLKAFILAGIPHENAYTFEKETTKALGEFFDKYNLNKPDGVVKLYMSNSVVGKMKFYRSLSTYLAMDDRYYLSALVPYIRKVNFYLNGIVHPGGQLFCGADVPEESLSKLIVGHKVRIPRVLSTSASADVAQSFRKSGNTFFTIEVPKDFWGAREVGDIGEFKEFETMFPPYSQFIVKAWSPTSREGTLTAIDKYAV